MTENQFWRDFEHIRGEVDKATQCFYTYLTIHATAGENKEVYRALNRHPSFWNIQLYSLQSTFFITMGRIFDNGKDAHSVHKLVATALAHPEFFSKEALARRKTESGKTAPDWLDEYISNAFEPKIDHLRTIKKQIAPYKKKFENTCLEIRNSVFAHTLVKDRDSVKAMYAKTEIVEIEEILYVLQDLVQALWQLFHNGRPLDFGNTSREYKNRVVEETRAAMVSLLLPAI